MMRRLLVALVALVLAAGGGFVLFRYVTGADQRAMAGMQTTDVLVVTKAVPKGTAAVDLETMVTLRSLPQVAVAASAVHDLSGLQGEVATTDLSPGEQLLTSHFADPGAAGLAPKLPAGTQEITLKLDPQRAVGGGLAPGDTVGVYLSTNINNHPQTHLEASKITVMSVAGAITTAGGSGAGDGSATAQGAGANNAGTEAVSVTLALTAPVAERVVFASEHGTVWLSKQTSTSSDSGRSVITERNLYR